MTDFKVLIVDDDYINRKLLISILKKKLYQIQAIESADGADALRSCYEYPDIQLVLLDIEMPHVDGLEFLRLFNQDEKLQKIPLIAISSNDMHKQNVYNTGADMFLVKPITEEKLFDAILQISI